MATSQIMPSDDLEVYVRRENSSTPRQQTTIGAIKEAMVAKGYNFILLLATTNYSQPCYAVVCKKIPDSVTELYLADNSLLATSSNYVVGYNPWVSGAGSFSYPDMYCFDSSGTNFTYLTGIEYNLTAKSVSGVPYYYTNENTLTTQANPAYIITTFTGIIYINYTPIISPSGGAGSGYIGNALVSNKKMVGYNVPLSVAESTKTESVDEASETPVSGKPKIGNGYARIKLLRALPDELVLYDNGQVNTDYFDTDAEIGQTDAEPISKNYEVKSNYLLLEYNNWRDTTSWRGIRLLFNKKMFPSVYTKVKIDLEIYAKYNSGWASIELNVNDNQTGVKNFNGGVGVRKVSDTRYQIAGQSSFEATSRYETDEMELLLSDTNYLVVEFSGVNQYHEGYAKIYKITLTM